VAVQVDYPKELWELASSLSDQAISAATSRAESLSFLDTASLQIPLEETIINLGHCRDVLLDLVSRERLIQLPLKIQARLLQETNKVAQTLMGITNGGDLLHILEASVEDLNATIWQFGLQNQSESVLGFERKMNELKAQSVEVNRSVKRARSLNKRIDEIEQLMARVAEQHDMANAHAADIATILGSIQTKDQKTTEVSDEISATFTLTKQYEDAIATAAVSARDAAAEAKESASAADISENAIAEAKSEYDGLVESTKELIGALKIDAETLADELKKATKTVQDGVKEQVDALIERIDEADTARDEKLEEQLETTVSSFSKETTTFRKDYQAKYEALEENSRVLLKNHGDNVLEIVERLKAIEAQIDGAILKATGFTLFHSFQTRQEQLQKSSRIWAIWLGVCLVFSIASAVTFLLMLPYFPSSGPAIYFKITLSLPFLAGVLFCGWQYTRERRLEEEYAFKSNISISLKPYQQLVDELVDKDNPEERAKYTAFIISSINKVFTSPTGLVFDEKEVMPTDAVKELLKTTISGATDIIKAKVK